MNQELGYLRDEQNRMLSLHNEHGSKTINMVLLVWGGAIAILGKEGIDFVKNVSSPNLAIADIHLHLPFFVATIFFISNMILFYSARKYYDRANELFRMSAYITVFCEKRPSNIAKVNSDNFCWELTRLEKMALDDLDKNKHRKKRNSGRNAEYKALCTFSLFAIFVCVLLMTFILYPTDFWNNDCNFIRKVYIVSPIVVCLTYLALSIYWRCIIPSYTSSRNNDGLKLKHLHEFIKYALDTGTYTEDELKSNFGEKLWVYIKKKMAKIDNEKRKLKEKQLSRIGMGIGRIVRFVSGGM